MSHTYKLTYGKGRGLAEISRLLFAVGEVDYEDIRWTPEEFQAKKQDLPFKTIPSLEVDGKVFCQGSAISRFLAKEFGLMGDNNMETLRIEEIVECIVDCRAELTKFYYEKAEAKRAEIMENTKSTFLPKLFQYLNMRLKENNEGKGFFVGDKLSYADLVVFNGFEMTNDLFKSDVLGSHLLLQYHRDRVAGDPRIAAWLKKRPVTEY